LGRGQRSDLSRSPPPVAENGDRSDRDRRPPCHDELRAVPGDQEDAITGSNASVEETPSDDIDRAPVRAEANSTFAADEICTVGPTLALLKEFSNAPRARMPDPQRMPVNVDRDHIPAPSIGQGR
jgi:hypothetical protein